MIVHVCILLIHAGNMDFLLSIPYEKRNSMARLYSACGR